MGKWILKLIFVPKVYGGKIRKAIEASRQKNLVSAPKIPIIPNESLTTIVNTKYFRYCIQSFPVQHRWKTWFLKDNLLHFKSEVTIRRPVHLNVCLWLFLLQKRSSFNLPRFLGSSYKLWIVLVNFYIFISSWTLHCTDIINNSMIFVLFTHFL